MKAKRICLMIIILLLIAGTFAIGYFLKQKADTNKTQNQTQNETSNSSKQATKSAVVTENTNIKVESPTPNEKVISPFTLKGSARVFENVVNFRLNDSQGKLFEGTTTAHSPDVGQFGPFEISLSYQGPRGDTGSIEVFSASPQDGSEINKIIIPITFDSQGCTYQKNEATGSSKAAKTLKTFFNSLATREYQKAYDLLDTEAQSSFTQEGKGTALENFENTYHTALDCIRVTDIKDVSDQSTDADISASMGIAWYQVELEATYKKAIEDTTDGKIQTYYKVQTDPHDTENTLGKIIKIASEI